MFEAERVNWHLDKLPKNRPEVIATQGKVMWKCRICHVYNSAGTFQCNQCGFKNPMTIGVQQHD